jgi:hypothetical protein
MNALYNPQIGEKPVSLRRLLTATSALPAATLALCLFVSSPAIAVPYEYSFLPGSTTELGGEEYAIMGGFIADEALNPPQNTFFDVSITLSPLAGPGGSFTGTYTEASGTCGASGGIACVFGSTAGGNTLLVSVASPGFAGESPIPLISSFLITTASAPVPVAIDSDPHAQLGVPEPASLTILGSALGLLGLRRRRSRTR